MRESRVSLSSWTEEEGETEAKGGEGAMVIEAGSLVVLNTLVEV